MRTGLCFIILLNKEKSQLSRGGKNFKEGCIGDRKKQPIFKENKRRNKSRNLLD